MENTVSGDRIVGILTRKRKKRNMILFEDTGWVDDVIHFDGVDWNLLDPTFAAVGQNSSVMDYITDSSNYQARFVY